MVASVVEMNDQEWPSLMQQQKHFRDDWELLDPDEKDDGCPDDDKDQECGDSSSFEVVIEADTIPNPRCLHHSNSSPNLSSSSSFLNSPTRVPNLGSVMEEDEESSFAMVSGPPSVWTTTTTTTGNLNYRNAILTASSSEAMTTPDVSPPRAKKNGLRKFQPRIVVVPTPPRMRRCTRSTGDLPKLSLDEQESANEFYQQKSMGMNSYSVGRKQRPDEIKRRALIIQKKDRQRKGNS